MSNRALIRLVGKASRCVEKLSPTLVAAVSNLDPNHSNKARNHVCIQKRNMAAGAAATTETTALPVYQEMLRRKLFSPDQFKWSGDPQIQSIETHDNNKILEISWKDGKISRFHSIWLRHNCHCPSCKLDVSAQCLIDITTIPDSTYIDSIDTNEANVLKLSWKEGNKSHSGYIPSQYLKHYTYSGNELERKSKAANIKFTNDTEIPAVEFKEVVETDTGLYRWLKLLGERGLCLIKNVPTVDRSLLRVTDRVALLQHTVYGEIFEVKDAPNSSNAAYTTIGLKLHMDQCTYESPPGIQFLHCLRFDDCIQGGDSVFADIFHIVNDFRPKYPEEFETLCKIPVTYETIGYEHASGRDKRVHLQIKKPMITTNRYGDVIAINYHEQLVGPLLAHENEVEPFYKAFRQLVKYVHDWPYKFHKHLQPGDMITFQNRRAIHGRDAYVSNGGERHFQGTYLNIDEFKSMLTYLHNTIGDGSPLCRMGLIDYS